jgi:hypothetical protein
VEHPVYQVPGSQTKHQRVIMGDPGYVGTSRTCANVIVPYGRPHHGQLTAEQKQANRIIPRDRILIENFSGARKLFWYKYRMTSLLPTSRVCSGTGSGILPGSLRMMKSVFANKTRLASSCRLHVETGMGAWDFLDILYTSMPEPYRMVPAARLDGSNCDSQEELSAI